MLKLLLDPKRPVEPVLHLALDKKKREKKFKTANQKPFLAVDFCQIQIFMSFAQKLIIIKEEELDIFKLSTWRWGIKNSFRSLHSIIGECTANLQM